LILVVIYEYGNIRDWFYINHSNLYITNISGLAFFLFFSIFIQRLINNQTYKKLIGIIIPLTLLCAIINVLFIQGFWRLDTITILLQFAVIIFIICIYFYELMNSIDISIPIIKMPGFWLNTGLLFFCLAQFLLYSSFSFLAYKESREYILLFLTFSNIANAILYTCLVVCFLCFKRIKTLS
jgi:hypothetical protein